MEYLLFLGLFTIAVARPDVGLGYRYQPPATSYGVPAGSVGTLNVNLNKQQQQPSGVFVGNVVPTAPATNFEVPVYNAGHFAGSTQTSAHGHPVPTTLFQSTGGGVSSGLSNKYQTSGYVDFQSNGYQQQTGAVEKHLYFFAAPEEPETIRSRIVYPQVPSKKNVKVIFIKAPSYRVEPIQIPVPQQNEEKTKIYVLVKKPEDVQLTAVPHVAPSEQTKPEVYFVKYNNQKEAEEAISSLQQGGSAGQNADILNGDSDLIKTIAKETEKKFDLDTRYFRDGGSEEDVLGGSVGLAALHQNRLKDDSGSISTTISPFGLDSESLSFPGVQSTGTVVDGSQSSLVQQQFPGTLNIDLSGSVGDSTVSSVGTRVSSGTIGDSISFSTKGGFSSGLSSSGSNSVPELQQSYLPPKTK